MDMVNRRHLYVLTALWLVVHAFLLYRLGIRDDLFDARGYMRAADYFLVHGHFQVAHQFFYALPIMLVAFFKTFPGGSVTGFVLFQCVLSGVAAWFLYRSAARVFQHDVAGFMAAAIFLAWWDVMQWNTAVMTESLACSLSCMVIFMLAHLRGTWKEYIVLALLLIACVLTRPTGVVIVFAALACLMVRHRDDVRRSGYSALLLTGLIVAAFCVMLLMLAYWDFTEQYVRGNIVTYMDTIEGQRLYHESLRLDTSHLQLPDPEGPVWWKMIFFVWNNPVHFFTAAALKSGYLLSGTRPYYSTFHNIYSLVWHAAVYVLFYRGIRAATDRVMQVFSISVIVLNCLLVAISTVDWDNRFYVPMQPAIVLFAGGGAALFFRSLMTGSRKG